MREMGAYLCPQTILDEVWDDLNDYVASQHPVEKKPIRPTDSIEVTLLYPGCVAPVFECKSVLDQEEDVAISLLDYRGKHLLLVFYQNNFSTICDSELHAFSKNFDQFQDLGCEVVCCSTDSLESHRAWIFRYKKHGKIRRHVKMPLIFDPNGEVSRTYGVFDSDTGLSKRATFLIGPDGVIRHVMIQDNLIGRNVKYLLQLVKTLAGIGHKAGKKHVQIIIEPLCSNE